MQTLYIVEIILTHLLYEVLGESNQKPCNITLKNVV